MAHKPAYLNTPLRREPGLLVLFTGAVIYLLVMWLWAIVIFSL